MGFRFPFAFGARDDTREIEHRAILGTLAPGYDVSEGTALYAETSAEAHAIEIIWAINRRVSNQRNPLKMLEDLSTWETICHTSPAVGDTDRARRLALSAKWRGLSGNSFTDLEEACSSVLGTAFGGLLLVDPSLWLHYWPGLNPGPPGYEWCSNRAIIGVRILKEQLSEPEYRRLKVKLLLLLNDIKPAWQTFSVGVGGDWIVNQAIVGQTVI